MTESTVAQAMARMYADDAEPAKIVRVLRDVGMGLSFVYGPAGVIDECPELRDVGWDRTPEIIEHLDDPTPTRSLNRHPVLSEPDQLDLIRISDCCAVIFTRITGLSPTKRGAEAWWKEHGPAGPDAHYLKRLPEAPGHSAERLLALHPERHLPVLIRLLHEGTREQQCQLLPVLASRLDEPSLEAFLSDENLTMAVCAARALWTRWKSTRAIAAVRERLRDPEYRELPGMIGALEFLLEADPEGMVELMTSAGSEVRIQAIKIALGKPAPVFVDTLFAILEDRATTGSDWEGSALHWDRKRSRALPHYGRERYCDAAAEALVAIRKLDLVYDGTEEERDALIGRIRQERRIELVGTLGSRRWRHAGEVDSVAFSPDGKLVLSASGDKTVKVWEAATGKELATWKGHRTSVSAVAFHPDGKRAVSAGSEGELIVWDVETGKAVATWTGTRADVIAIAVGRKRALSGGADTKAVLRDVDTGQVLATWGGHDLAVSSVALSPDGKRALTGSMEGRVRLRDVETGKSIRTWEGTEDGITSLLFGADGKRAYIASVDRSIRVWDLETGKIVSTWTGHTGFVSSVALSPDEKTAVTGSFDRTIRVWEIATGRNVATWTGHRACVNSVAYSPDGKTVVSGGSDGTVRRWTAATGECDPGVGHEGEVLCVATSPDGKRAITGGRDKMVRYWDLPGARELAVWKGHTKEVMSVAIHPDGKKAVSGGRDRMIMVWDLEKREGIGTWRGHEDAVLSLAFSPDGKRLWSGGFEETWRCWDVERGKEAAAWKGQAAILALDGMRAVSGGYKGLRVWDLETGKELAWWEGHQDWVNTISISPDGERALTAGQDGALRQWELEYQTEIARWKGHQGAVVAAAFLSDGKRAVSVGEDSTLRLWDVESGKEVDSIVVDGRPRCLAVTGDLVLIGNANTTVTVYNLK